MSALILVLIFFYDSGARSVTVDGPSDTARDQLVGPVHTIRNETFSVLLAGEELTKGQRVELITETYSKAGYETEWVRWCDPEPRGSDAHATSDWRICEKIVTSFSVDGTKRESLEFVLCDGEPYVGHKWSYVVYAHGHSVELFTYGRKGDVISRSFSTYSSDGEEIDSAWFREDGTIANRTFFMYDALSRLVQEACYKPDGSLNRKDVYTYNKHGDLEQEDSYDERGAPVERIIYSNYEFDVRGNWTKRRRSAWWGHDNEWTDPKLSVNYRTITYY